MQLPTSNQPRLFAASPQSSKAAPAPSVLQHVKEGHSEPSTLQPGLFRSPSSPSPLPPGQSSDGLQDPLALRSLTPPESSGLGLQSSLQGSRLLNVAPPCLEARKDAVASLDVLQQSPDALALKSAWSQPFTHARGGASHASFDEGEHGNQPHSTGSRNGERQRSTASRNSRAEKACSSIAQQHQNHMQLLSQEACAAMGEPFISGATHSACRSPSPASTSIQTSANTPLPGWQQASGQEALPPNHLPMAPPGPTSKYELPAATCSIQDSAQEVLGAGWGWRAPSNQSASLLNDCNIGSPRGTPLQKQPKGKKGGCRAKEFTAQTQESFRDQMGGAVEDLQQRRSIWRLRKAFGMSPAVLRNSSSAQVVECGAGAWTCS